MLKINTKNQGFCWILADVHLSTEDSHPINQSFIKFIKEEAHKADALFILGDLFEVWVGDDIGLDTYQNVIQALKDLATSGTPVYLLYGNRDFLMRSAFVNSSGVKLLPDINTIQLYHQDYLLLHGDTLCTDDKDYQRMRKVLRNRLMQFFLLSLSQKRRQKIADSMRQKSKNHTQKKAQAIMDVSEQAVQQLMHSYPQVKHLIHGHTHRPAHHKMNIDGIEKHRWVLGDWRPEAKILKISASGPEFFEWD